MYTKYVQSKKIKPILYTKCVQNMYKQIVFTGFGVGGLLSTFQNMFGDSSHVIADRLRNTISSKSYLVNILDTKQQLI